MIILVQYGIILLIIVAVFLPLFNLHICNTHLRFRRSDVLWRFSVTFNSYAATADIIDSDESGILIPPMDCEKYANALAALMRDSARRIHMAEAAMKRAKSFSREKIAERWENLLKILR